MSQRLQEETSDDNALREAAGLNPWREDALRHAFAGYHLRYFKDLQRLQLEMGYSTAKLLFNCYLNMEHISNDFAAAFWCMSLPLLPKQPKPAAKEERRERASAERRRKTRREYRRKVTLAKNG